MKSLENKVAIITGATSGMGAATARNFALEGAEVILLGRSKERGMNIENEIKNSGGKAKFLFCDVSKKESIVSVFDIISQCYKKIDILFNNAGIFVTSTLEELDDEDWHKTFATNLDGVVYMTKFFKELLKNAHGTIINNASIGGLDSYTSGRAQYIYATSKAAVIKFSKLCALNFAPEVRVNCICPGIVDTEIFINKDFSRFNGTIPLGRLAKPEEIARVVLFLASKDAEYITGAVIPIDGGASLL